MKTALVILLVALALVLLVKGFPFIMLPAGLAFGGLLLFFCAVLAVAVALCSGVLGLGLGLLCLLLVLACLFAPVWLPVLALFGLVSLFRRRKLKSA